MVLLHSMHTLSQAFQCFYLHSNMVLLQLGSLSVPRIPYLFTFQYGSTSIRRPKSPLNPVFLTTILSTFFSHKIQYIIITIFYHLFFHFSLIFQQLSTSQDFHFTSGRQSQEITCFIILYTPHFFWYPLFIPALEHNNRISIFSNFRF